MHVKVSYNFLVDFDIVDHALESSADWRSRDLVLLVLLVRLSITDKDWYFPGGRDASSGLWRASRLHDITQQHRNIQATTETTRIIS